MTQGTIRSWEERLTKLSNRLTRYSFVSGHSADSDDEVLGRLRAEARASEIVFAAGAMEDSWRSISQTTRRLQRVKWPTETVFSPSMRDLKILGSRSAYRGYYEFHNMLWWGRSLLERIEGNWLVPEQPVGGRTKKRLVNRPVGLIAFLPQEDAGKIRQLRDVLREGAFAEVKDLADYSLHAFVIPTSQAMVRFTDRGLVLPLPDRLSGRLMLAQEFTFNEGRNVGAYADDLWGGVRELVGGVLTVLEASQLRIEEGLLRTGSI